MAKIAVYTSKHWRSVINVHSYQIHINLNIKNRNHEKIQKTSAKKNTDLQSLQQDISTQRRHITNGYHIRYWYDNQHSYLQKIKRVCVTHQKISAMLKNELQDIEEILIERIYSDSNKTAQTDLKTRFGQIYQAWEEVLFSNMPECSLVRYFHYHLDIISTISTTLSNFPDSEKYLLPQNELLALIDHLRKYYSSYFNEDAIAPRTYHQRLVPQLTGDICAIQKTLQSSSLNAALIACLLKWFNIMSEDIGKVKFTFRSLCYFGCIICQLGSLDYDSDNVEKLLVSLLIRSNFNNLSFFVYYQDTIWNALGDFRGTQERLNYLVEQKAEIMSSPEVKNIAFDPSWPSIKSMIGNWLTEEILITEKSLCKGSEVPVPKIPVEMSVAHLSCLIRLLYEESVFATQNLQFIFKCFAGHYQSKRQAVISPGSLSKEFYSIDQHTAARVRDLLQRMVQRINRNFFPMTVAINATVLSYLSMR
ncbi:hypothetical protein [Pedobacter kyonggii]|uniref:Uncharacterized protein n=1 Tax=Pedobacter kyonggii TaxID=1926871 RepID=A0A4Q9HDC5_9SPHI|nr:hypothetical protein [Pedobacter kyonggii]TBO42235.1 hypothetical protein EYS08_11975 [Pedobacter kyonggii]